MKICPEQARKTAHTVEEKHPGFHSTIGSKSDKSHGKNLGTAKKKTLQPKKILMKNKDFNFI